MEIQIDQSIKIEQTARTTYIGLSNSMTFIVAITGKTKRRLQDDFRRRGLSSIFPTATFAACVALLIFYTRFDSNPAIIIDEEYQGYEQFLRKQILHMLTDLGGPRPVITFSRIGKGARAHIIGYQAYKKRRSPDRLLSYVELHELTTKNRPGT